LLQFPEVVGPGRKTFAVAHPDARSWGLRALTRG